MIGITGATGEVGGKVLGILKDKNVPLCALVRNLQKCSDNSWNGIEKRHFDITHQPNNVFDGITSLLWILPSNHQNLILNEAQWIGLAKKAGVKHIVKLSSMEPDQQNIFHHLESELIIEQSGISYAHLRANAFMQNFNNSEIEPIVKKYTLFDPAGNGKISFIDTRDIGSVAAEILLHPENHRNKVYTLTGRTAYDYYEIAKAFSEIFGIKICYVDTHQHPEFEREEYKQEIIQHYFKAVREGWFAPISKDVEMILNRKPISLKQYIEDYKNLFLDKMA